MPAHIVPHRIDIAGRRSPAGRSRVARALNVLAAPLIALSLASAPTLTRAASALSDGSVTPPSGTTATAFTFSVHYASTDNPTRPAQAVWAQVGSVTLALTKVSGTAHDGTWLETATLPAGTWQVTFYATASGDPQPEPLLGPMVTVTEPPTPTPSPTPAPPPPTPQPTATPAPPPPTPQPTATPAPPPPTPLPTATPSPPPLLPVPQPTPRPTNPTPSPTPQPPSPSPTPSASGSGRPTTPLPTPTQTAGDDDPAGTPGPSEPAADDAATPTASMLASLLFIGGSMSIVGAAVLARQWYVSRGARPH